MGKKAVETKNKEQVKETKEALLKKINRIHGGANRDLGFNN